jgi:RNA polymerase sigma-70 factor (ECF subfamily)
MVPPDSAAGDPTAAGTPPAPAPDFESLLRQVLAPAFGAALHLTCNRQDAEDLVQEAALRAFRSFHTFTQGTNFKAWFFRILLNRFYTAYRRRRPEASLQELEDAHELYLYGRANAAGLRGPDADPARRTLDVLARADITAALDALPDDYRVACTMYFIEDFSYQEIADMLGIPIGTVRSRLHRGRRMLQKALWRHAVDQGLVGPGASRAEGENA